MSSFSLTSVSLNFGAYCLAHLKIAAKILILQVATEITKVVKQSYSVVETECEIELGLLVLTTHRYQHQFSFCLRPYLLLYSTYIRSQKFIF